GLRPGGDGRRRLRGRGRSRPLGRDLPPQDPDERRRPAGAARVSSTAWAWLVLLFPLAGSIVCALSFRVIPARAAGAIGTAAVGLAFLCGVAALVNLLGDPAESRHHASSLWDYASAAGLDIKLGIYVDPLSIFMVLIVTGVSTLIHLYSFGYMGSDAGDDQDHEDR